MTKEYLKFGWVGTVMLGLSMHLCSQQPLPLPEVSSEAEANAVVTPKGYRPPALPEAMTFAGEPVPLDMPDVAERLDKELLINTFSHYRTMMGLKRMQRYVPEMRRVLRENDVPEDFVYLALAESLFGHVKSPAGAAGFWQLMPDTARGYGMIVNGEVDERYHVEKSTQAAIRYLKTAKKRFGNWTNAAAAYNRGMGGIARALEKQGVSSYYDLYLNDETSRYMFRILALKEVLGNPQKYGFDFSEEHGYNPLPTRPLVVTSSIPDLPAFAIEQGTNYKTLRYYNPWIRSYDLTVPKGKEFVLQLPE